MKLILTLIACTLLLGMFIFTSCKKVPVEVTPTPGASQPPRASAGPDQTITLPTDSVTLDGSGSTDPDNNIAGYRWTKISGPQSYLIVQPTGIQTRVRQLAEGIYQFELKVTDAGGTPSQDTVQITVSAPAAGSCSDIALKIVNGPGSLTPYGSLSEPRLVKPTAAADKIVFGGGELAPNTFTDAVDIYTFSTNTWSTAKLSQPGDVNNVTVGNKILFIGNRVIDIYDAVANTWSAHATPANIGRFTKTAVINNNVFFVGASKIDIYDVAANTWTTAPLSETRDGVTTVVAGNKLILAGGYKAVGFEDYPTDLSSRLDIYDAATEVWSTAELPKAAFAGSAAAVGNKVVFYFENTSTHVTIYDVAANTWSTAPLSIPRYYSKVSSVGNKILVVGGTMPGNANAGATVDIYDVSTNSWSVAKLNHPGRVFWSAAIGNKLLMSVSMNERIGNIFDMYDASIDAWSKVQLNYSLFSYPVVADNKIFFGGGRVGSTSNYYFSCNVWKFQF